MDIPLLLLGPALLLMGLRRQWTHAALLPYLSAPEVVAGMYVAGCVAVALTALAGRRLLQKRLDAMVLRRSLILRPAPSGQRLHTTPLFPPDPRTPRPRPRWRRGRTGPSAAANLPDPWPSLADATRAERWALLGHVVGAVTFTTAGLFFAFRSTGLPVPMFFTACWLFWICAQAGLSREWFGLGPRPIALAWIHRSGDVEDPRVAMQCLVLMPAHLKGWTWAAGIDRRGRSYRQLLPDSTVEALWGPCEHPEPPDPTPG